MFQRCFDDKQFKQAIGIALETHRIDIFENAIMKSDDTPAMLSYSLKVCLSFIQNRQFRNTVLRVLVKLYMSLETADYISVCQCFIFLDDPQAVAEILEKLMKDTEDSTLMAYQIGFDLYESATQQFLQRVQAALRSTAPIPIPSTPASAAVAAALTAAEAAASTEEAAADAGKEVKMETEADVKTEPPAATPTPKVEELSESDKQLQDRITKLHTILGGETTIGIHLQFLIRNNKSDLLILKNTKDAVRNSVCHSATVIANAFMHMGTTSDQFLRWVWFTWRNNSTQFSQ